MNIEELKLVIELIRDLGEFSLWGLVVWVGVDLLKMILVVGSMVGTICYVAKLVFRSDSRNHRLYQVYTQVMDKPPTQGYMNSDDMERLTSKIAALKAGR